MHGQSTCAVLATETHSSKQCRFSETQLKVGTAPGLSPCRLTGQTRAVSTGVRDCGAMTAWLCSPEHTEYGLCLSLHCPIAIPGNQTIYQHLVTFSGQFLNACLIKEETTVTIGFAEGLCHLKSRFPVVSIVLCQSYQEGRKSVLL